MSEFSFSYLHLQSSLQSSLLNVNRRLALVINIQSNLKLMLLIRVRADDRSADYYLGKYEIAQPGRD